MPFVTHPLFEPPENREAGIWRYLDFTKYVAMLESESLYFCSARVLRDIDPFEGRRTYLDEQKRRNFLEAKWEDQPPEFWASIGYTDPVHFVTMQNVSRIPSPFGGDVALNSMFVNSWHVGDSESDAMWKLYASPTQGVAIVSTYQALLDSIEKTERPVMVGVVKYKDFRRETTPFGNLLSPFIQKKVEFSHEKELRALIWRTDFMHDKSHLEAAKLRGFTVPIDFRKLAKAVYVSPLADTWFHELVESVTRRYGFDLAVKQSDIRANS